MRGNSHVFIRYAQNEDGTTDFGRVWLDYYSVPLVKQILTIIGDDPTYVIDNEFNTILRGDEFVARIRSDPGWEWKV